MPKADWKKCAVCVALPTAQTAASQPLTGNGSSAGSCSTSPTSCLSVSRSRSARTSSLVRVSLRDMSCSFRAVCVTQSRTGRTWWATCRARTVQNGEIGRIRAPADGQTGYLRCMTDEHVTDALDVALLRALHEHPRIGDLELSRTARVARATVQGRLRRLDEH